MKRYGILDRIKKTSELRELPYSVMEELCTSLREFLVDHVSQTGGHLASNLGIVELSVALERVFDSSRDRIIYDVGHQAYVHKILTGRKEQFESLRQYGGLSGFMKPEESHTDPCITGHASNSVSVALGMAHARTLLGQKYHVVAVIGDGALTGGMAYEALNSAGGSGEPLLVVLNDNNMSITQNVGAMSKHLAHLRVNPGYLNAKTQIKDILSQVPGGKAVTARISHFKNNIKNVVLPTTLFEQMGFAYLGPVDGHDLKAVCELLERAKVIKKPVLLHIMTRKGRGYAPAESSPDKYHGVGPFDKLSGKPLKPSGMNFSACFGEALCDLAAHDERICAVTAAMSSGTGLTGFSQKYPTRFFDVGIAEEHAIAMGAGMAKQGLKPVCAIYSTFLQRAYDQLIHDVAIEGINLVLGIDRAGIVGEDGATHNGVFDIAFLRSIPGMTLLAPSSYSELRTMLSQAFYHRTGPVAIRYPRGGQGSYDEDHADASVVCLRQGNDAILVSYGILINQTLEAAKQLSEHGVSAAVYKINELTNLHNLQMLEHIARCGVLVVVEDVVETGSIGEAIAALLTERGSRLRAIKLLNTDNRFLPCGSVQKMYEICHLNAESIVGAVMEAKANE